MKRLILALCAALVLSVCLSACGREDGPVPAESVSGTAAPDVSADGGTEAVPSEAPTLPPETDAPAEEPTEAPTEPVTESPTEPETEPGTEPADTAPTLGELIDDLRLDEGVRIDTAGSLKLNVNVFGMLVDTELPMNGSLAAGDAGVMLTTEIPFAGTSELRFVNNAAYLTSGDRKLVFSLIPGAVRPAEVPQSGEEPAAGDVTAPADAPADAPAEELGTGTAEEPAEKPVRSFDFSALPALWEGLRARFEEALWLLPVTLPEEDGFTYTVNLAAWASDMADSLSWESDPDENIAALLEWMELIAADEAASLSVSADPADPSAPLSLTLDCPVSVSLLTRFLSLLSGISDAAGQDASGMDDLLSRSVSDARFSLSVTLSGGPQDIVPPVDAEEYVVVGE